MNPPIQHYTVESEKLFAGEFPGARNPESAADKLKFLTGLGIRTFIDLTEARDGLQSYWNLLTTELTYHNFPIPDGGLPMSRKYMREIIDSINRSIAAGKPVYVHCWGGIGRTGTVIGCWLAENGFGKSAAERVQELYAANMPKVSRMPNSPETPAQRDYVIDWGWNLEQTKS